MNKINCVQIELTNHCNYNCINCPRSADQLTRAKGYMDYDLFKKVMDESFEVADFINFSFFGEPVLHPHFLKFMDYVLNRPKGFKVVMNSNMSLVTKDVFEKFIEVSISHLRVSVDAATNETYDVVRPSSGCKTLDGEFVGTNRLDVIDSKLRYWFNRKDHVATRHVFPVSSVNVHEAPLYVAKWYPLLSDRDEILIKNILTYGGKNTDSMIMKSSCNVWELGVVTIDWEGNVSPCNLDTDMDLIIGNVKEHSIVDVWNSKQYSAMKNKSLSRTIHPCDKCVDSNNWKNNITVTRKKKFDIAQFNKKYGGRV